MTPIADVIVRTSIVLAAGLLLRSALAGRSAAVRHAVMTATLLGAAAVVPLSLVTPSWTIALPAVPAPRAAARVAMPAVTNGAAAIAAMPSSPRRPQVPVAALTWAGGCAIGLLVLAAGVIRLARVSMRAARVADDRWIAAARSVGATYGLDRDVVLLQGDAPFLLATWGLRPARILLPPDALEWTDERVHAVLCHELAHVQRADWLVQIAAHIVVAALWFNPLAWLVCRQLRRDSEQACDNAVLDRGIRAPDYANHLVALARHGRAASMLPALPMARPSAFERRIAAMLNPRLDRRPMSRRTVAAFAVVVAAVTLATAAVRAVQAPPTALTGTVYDTTGAVMPGVAITLEDPQQRTAQSSTDASGRFAFPGIGSGHYVLSAALPGFKTLRDTFDLTNAPDWDRAVTLQVGTLQETITVSAGRLASGGLPASTGTSPVRVRVGGNIRAPRKTLDVKPVYPDSMRMAGREGQVPIEATIGADGSVSSVRVLSAQVHPDFAIAAVDAVRQWQFTPTLLNGVAVEVVMTVTVQFKLAD